MNSLANRAQWGLPRHSCASFTPHLLIYSQTSFSWSALYLHVRASLYQPHSLLIVPSASQLAVPECLIAALACAPLDGALFTHARVGCIQSSLLIHRLPRPQRPVL